MTPRQWQGLIAARCMSIISPSIACSYPAANLGAVRGQVCGASAPHHTCEHAAVGSRLPRPTFAPLALPFVRNKRHAWCSIRAQDGQRPERRRHRPTPPARPRPCARQGPRGNLPGCRAEASASLGRPRGGAVVILLWWCLRGLGRLAWAIGDDLFVIVGLKWRDSMGRTWWHV